MERRKIFLTTLVDVRTAIYENLDGLSITPFCRHMKRGFAIKPLRMDRSDGNIIENAGTIHLVEDLLESFHNSQRT